MIDRKTVKQRIDQLFTDFVRIRREFHKYPELGEQEFLTSARICDYLEKWGIEYTPHVADTGVVAFLRGKGNESGKTVGIRADMDALPLLERATVPYHSVHDNVMHACGHDIHITIALGVARILKEFQEELMGNVKFFFQPAEESVGGAKRMVQAGCMHNPKVDYVTGLHVMPNYEVGEIEYRYGSLNASSDDVILKIHGKSGHGAYPETGVDAVLLASHIVVALQSIVSRNLSPLDSAVLSFGTIQGGTRANIICDEVVVHGTLRTITTSTRALIKTRIKEVASHMALALGGSCEIEIQESYDALINDDKIVDIVCEAGKRILGEKNVYQKEYPSLGVEDFSFFLSEAQGAYYHLGCGNKKKGITAFLHNKEFDVDEECIRVGIQMQIEIILDLCEADQEEK